MKRLAEFLKTPGADTSVDRFLAYLLAFAQGSDGRGRKPLRPASLKHVHSPTSAFDIGRANPDGGIARADSAMG